MPKVIDSVASVLEILGPEEAMFLREAIRRWWEVNDPHGDVYQCYDNDRFALKGDEASEAQYEEIANGGCCGSVDVELGPSPSGRTYLYGFNYGH